MHLYRHSVLLVLGPTVFVEGLHMVGTHLVQNLLRLWDIRTPSMASDFRSIIIARFLPFNPRILARDTLSTVGASYSRHRSTLVWNVYLLSLSLNFSRMLRNLLTELLGDRRRVEVGRLGREESSRQLVLVHFFVEVDRGILVVGAVVVGTRNELDHVGISNNSLSAAKTQLQRALTWVDLGIADRPLDAACSWETRGKTGNWQPCFG